jgi:hypothetical protein
MNRNQFREDPTYVQIDETVIEKTMLMHIQDKNLHGKIFVLAKLHYRVDT